MEPTVKEKIENYYGELPPMLKAAVTSLPLSEIVYNIGRGNGLAIDKTGDLAREVFQFIGGTSNADDLIAALLSLNGGDRKKAAAIARQLNDRVFLPIRDLLKKATAKPAPDKEKVIPERTIASTPPFQALPTAPVPAAGSAAPVALPPVAQTPEKKINVMALLREAMKTPPASETTKAPTAEKPAPTMPPAGTERKATESSIGKYAPSPSLPVARTIYPIPPARREEGPVIQEIKPAEPRIQIPPRPVQKPAPPAEPMAPRYVITKGELEKEIERVKKENGSSGPKPEPPKPHEVGPRKVDLMPKPESKSYEARPREIDRPREVPREVEMPPTTPKYEPPLKQAAPQPLKLPEQKIPKPPAPEKYEIDPYKELVE